MAALSFTACGKKKATATKDNTTTVAPTPTPDPEPVKLNGNYCYLSTSDEGIIVNNKVENGELKYTNIVYLDEELLCIQITLK